MTITDWSGSRVRSHARLDDRLPTRLQVDLEPDGEFSIPAPTGLDNGWMRDAACLDSEPEVFFPPGPSALEHLELARSVCRTCAVVGDCLRVALGDPTLVGVWGGTSETERAVLRRRPARAGATGAPAQGLVWIST
jgi:WhiB family redox-sensing transcriptional regulator